MMVIKKTVVHYKIKLTNHYHLLLKFIRPKISLCFVLSVGAKFAFLFISLVKGITTHLTDNSLWVPLKFGFGSVWIQNTFHNPSMHILQSLNFISSFNLSVIFQVIFCIWRPISLMFFQLWRFNSCLGVKNVFHTNYIWRHRPRIHLIFILLLEAGLVFNACFHIQTLVIAIFPLVA